jgi:transposase
VIAIACSETVPVAVVPATRCLIELPELGQLGEKPIARLVGVAPMNRDSGQFRGKRMIAGGRTHVRCGLYMAAWVATRRNPVIRAFYQRLLAKGKCHQVAVIAGLRKRLVILNAMMRDQLPWRDAVTSATDSH